MTTKGWLDDWDEGQNIQFVAGRLIFVSCQMDEKKEIESYNVCGKQSTTHFKSHAAGGVD